MHAINTRGTYSLTRACLPYLKQAAAPRVLNISPPLESLHPPSLKRYKTNHFKGKVAYSLAKYGMTLCALGLAAELATARVAVNILWPRTKIATAVNRNLLGGEDTLRMSRSPSIMGDAAYLILISEGSGNTYYDEDVLAYKGVKVFTKYR